MVGEFDITKTDPDEQVLKVNRIISHPKVKIHVNVIKIYNYSTYYISQSDGKSVNSPHFYSTER